MKKFGPVLCEQWSTCTFGLLKYFLRFQHKKLGFFGGGVPGTSGMSRPDLCAIPHRIGQNVRKRAEYCFKSTVSEQRTH